MHKMSQKQLTNLLQSRIKALESERQNYQRNPAIANNVKKANVDLIENDIVMLKKILSDFSHFSLK